MAIKATIDDEGVAQLAVVATKELRRKLESSAHGIGLVVIDYVEPDEQDATKGKRQRFFLDLRNFTGAKPTLALIASGRGQDVYHRVPIRPVFEVQQQADGKWAMVR